MSESMRSPDGSAGRAGAGMRSNEVGSGPGFRWIGDDAAMTPPRAPMFVQWDVPAAPSAPCPIVFVHGGGGQGTDWWGTPDGRPGWAPLLAARGWPVYVVDRPGYGRAAGAVAQGERSPAPTPYMVAGIFAPGIDPGHTQWPGPGGPTDPAIGQLTAASAGLFTDSATAQELDGSRLVQLLERIGPAVVVTHSFGAAAGWLAADARPDLVRAVVALEPPGPPFLDLPAAGVTLPWGLTAAPLTYDPPAMAAGELQNGIARALPNLAEIPVAVVEAPASPLGGGAEPVTRYLQERGVGADHIRLADHGVHGNGHGMIFERNHTEVLEVVERWLLRRLPSSSAARRKPE